jgi:hypothetical protein
VAALGLLEVGVDELRLDRLDVPQRVDVALGMDDVGVAVGPHDVKEGVGLADVAQELVAEPLALVCARDQPGDVMELDGVVDDARSPHRLGNGVQSLVGHRHHGDVGLDRREGVVGRLGAGLRQGVEQRRLARVGQPHDADLHRPNRPRTVPRATPAAMSEG